jgi:hypothetical protein
MKRSGQGRVPEQQFQPCAAHTVKLRTGFKQEEENYKERDEKKIRGGMRSKKKQKDEK